MTDYIAIGGAALSTGIATAAFTQFFAWRKENKADTRSARYLAIRIAIILERFALDCAEIIGDQNLFDSSSGHAGRRHGTLPSLSEYPDEDNWKSLEADFLERALSLRNELVISDRTIGFWEEIGEMDCIQPECNQQSGKCGYIAWRLASDMRAYYRLSRFQPDKTSWDFASALKPHYDDALDEARKRVERNRSKISSA